MAEFRRSTRVPGLEARSSCGERSCYRLHSHDALAIGLIDEGSTVVTGALDGAVRLRPGEVIVIPAGQVHACNPDAGRWGYRMVWAAPFRSWDARSPVFDAVRVFRSPELPGLVRAVADGIADDAGPALLESSLLALTAALAAAEPAHRATVQEDADLLDRLAPVLHRLRTAETNPALDDLAGSVGMTRDQLVRAMRRATGLPPLAWRQNARIIRARRMLGAGRPIADTAAELGFTDQSHFHRVFRAHVAAPPGAYRG